MRLPAELDSFVERALLGRLRPRERGLLKVLLGLNSVLGFALAWRHPEVAALALLFPCVVLVFFGAPPALNLAWLGLFTVLRPHPLEIACFALAVAIGTLFAHVTGERYRQSRLRQLDLEKAMELARRRQEQLEPPACQVLLDRLEVACSLQVCRQLGGDFLCVRALGPQRVSLVLGDVMGKGPAAGLVAVYLEGVYDQLAGQGLEPADLLAGLNRSLADFDRDEPLFATAVCVEADFEQGLWKVARAGHEPPRFLPGRAWRDAAHLPLGLNRQQAFVQETLPLHAGDCVVMVSDGLTDRLGSLEDMDLVSGPAEPSLAALVARDAGDELADDESAAWLRVLR